MSDKATPEVTTEQTDGTVAQRPDGRLPVGEFKRLPQQSCYRLPAGAKSAEVEDAKEFGGIRYATVVPVSSVAREWGISSRRVRVMLEQGRLDGRRLENGYWEVFYPYRYVFGTRGPQIRRQRNLPDKPKKPERMPEW